MRVLWLQPMYSGMRKMTNPDGEFRRYIDWKPKAETLEVVDRINGIVSQYDAKGLKLTLRQVYYQFVARGWLPNTQENYNRLGRILSDARMAGLVSWTAIEDRNRTLRGVQTYEHPNEILKAAVSSYKLDLWADQPWRPEVWVEKAALEGVIEGICNKLRVDFFAQRGYNSMSAQWEAGQRFASYVRRGQRPIVFHLGDHDPSGLDMTEDNRKRLEIFAGVPVLVVRLALNRDQINQFNPPPNPAKDTDSRFEAYRKEHGESSWELDALDPEVIQTLISGNVARVRDEVLWHNALEREIADKRVMEDMMEQMRTEE